MVSLGTCRYELVLSLDAWLARAAFNFDVTSSHILWLDFAKRAREGHQNILKTFQDLDSLSTTVTIKYKNNIKAEKIIRE